MENSEQIHDRLVKRFKEISKETSGGLGVEIQKYMQPQKLPDGTSEEWATFLYEYSERLIAIQSKLFKHQIDSLLILIAEMEFDRASQD